MSDTQQMTDLLKGQRAKALATVKAIDDLLTAMGEDIESLETYTYNSTVPVGDFSRRRQHSVRNERMYLHEPHEDFPVDKPIEEQMLYILRDNIGTAAKISQIQQRYEDLSGSRRNIMPYLRKMKDMDMVRAVRYNNANKLTYWGMPNWMDGGDYSQNYRPAIPANYPAQTLGKNDNAGDSDSDSANDSSDNRNDGGNNRNDGGNNRNDGGNNR